MTAAFKRRKIDPERVSHAAKATLEVAGLVSDWAVGQVQEIPLNRIKPNPANARAWYPAKTLSSLVESIKAQGQLTPASAFLDESGDVVLINGHRRLRACAVAGLTVLRVELRPAPVNQQALYIASREANLYQSGHTPLDDAVVWNRLIRDKVFKTQKELAEILGVSSTEVSRVIALANLPELALIQLSEHEEMQNLKMLNALREFFEAHGEPRLLQLLKELAASGGGYRDVELRKKELAAQHEKTQTTSAVQRPRALTQSVYFKTGTGKLKVFDGGSRVVLELSGLPETESRELLKKLERIVSQGTPHGEV